jgi:hypothetical protein
MSSAIGYNIQSALHAEDSPEIPGESSMKNLKGKLSSRMTATGR